MAIKSLKTGAYSRSMLVGNPYNIPGAYDSISTLTVGAGGTAYVEFTAIPQTYSHLEIRGIARTTFSATQSALGLQMNGDTAGNYSIHGMYTDGGTGIGAYGLANYAFGPSSVIAGNTATANSFGILICTILDYKETTKFKTGLVLSSANSGSSGQTRFSSGVWRSTSAISSIKIYDPNGGNLQQYSTFSLYGIKAA